MKTFRLALLAFAVAAALPVAAAAANTTYAFSSASSSTSGVTSFNGTSLAAYQNNGTDYGNTISWGTGGGKVTVSAWANTGTSGLFEKAYVGNYGGALGVTSQPMAGVAANANPELSYVDASSGYQPNPPQHALDNNGAYEALAFTFQSAVTLANVNVGWTNTDSDATILYYTGSGDPNMIAGSNANLSARTLTDLTSHGWAIAENVSNLAIGGNSTGLSASISSQYWLVGAYAGLGGNTIGTSANTIGTGNDYFKVSGLTVSPRAVPEPGSIALLGIAGAALVIGRRRKARKD